MAEETITEETRSKLKEAYDNTSKGKAFNISIVFQDGRGELLEVEYTEEELQNYTYWKTMFDWYNERQTTLGRIPKTMYCMPCYATVRDYVKRMLLL